MDLASRDSRQCGRDRSALAKFGLGGRLIMLGILALVVNR